MQAGFQLHGVDHREFDFFANTCKQGAIEELSFDVTTMDDQHMTGETLQDVGQDHF